VADSLATYLHDHHAGARFAIELLESLRDKHLGQSIGEFASAFLVQVEEDRATLQKIIERIDDSASALRNAAAWVSEKATEFKFQDGPLGTFEALEAIALGVLGKLKMWEVLAKISAYDDRLRAFNFAELASRARLQHLEAERQRLEAAEDAFAAAVKR
jgi:hypothetical protein